MRQACVELWSLDLPLGIGGQLVANHGALEARRGGKRRGDQLNLRRPKARNGRQEAVRDNGLDEKDNTVIT